MSSYPWLSLILAYRQAWDLSGGRQLPSFHSWLGAIGLRIVTYTDLGNDTLRETLSPLPGGISELLETTPGVTRV